MTSRAPPEKSWGLPHPRRRCGIGQWLFQGVPNEPAPNPIKKKKKKAPRGLLQAAWRRRWSCRFPFVFFLSVVLLFSSSALIPASRTAPPPWAGWTRRVSKSQPPPDQRSSSAVSEVSRSKQVHQPPPPRLGQPHGFPGCFAPADGGSRRWPERVSDTTPTMDMLALLRTTIKINHRSIISGLLPHFPRTRRLPSTMDPSRPVTFGSWLLAPLLLPLDDNPSQALCVVNTASGMGSRSRCKVPDPWPDHPPSSTSPFADRQPQAARLVCGRDFFRTQKRARARARERGANPITPFLAWAPRRRAEQPNHAGASSRFRSPSPACDAWPMRP